MLRKHILSWRNVRLLADMLRRRFWMAVAAQILNLGYPHHLKRVKNAVVRRYVGSVGQGTNFSPGLLVFRGFNTFVGQRCSLGYHFQIFDFETVSIGDDFLASHNVTLIAGTHTQDEHRTYIPGPIHIGKRVWIGANVVIVGPCTIGDNCVIGANSFVKGDIPANATIGGSPARILKSAT